jgi:ferredoxin/flavodoxin
MVQTCRRAVVVTYSQTGQTALIGRLIAALWETRGLSVDSVDIRNFDVAALSSYDLIMAGSPVFYWDVPSNVIEALSAAPRLDGICAASFVTYGGEGGNQHNTALRLLALLAGHGALPVGMETFGAMSSYAPTWSLGNEKRVLAYRHRPDEQTYDRIRRYADAVLTDARKGNRVRYKKEFFLTDFLRGKPSIAFSKLVTGRHAIDREVCTDCGICASECPVGAIDLEKHSVDTSRCVSCLGCVNNCPVGAIDMTYMGRKVYGFREFRKRNGIRIVPPEELRKRT